MAAQPHAKPLSDESARFFIDAIPIGEGDARPYRQFVALEQKAAIVQACLERDRMDLWKPIHGVFESRHIPFNIFSKWAETRMTEVLQSNPNLIAYWREWSDTRLDLREHFLATLLRGIDALEQDVGEGGRLALLLGEPCAGAPAVGNALAGLLAKNPSAWGFASPAWIGSKNSALRAHAIAAGWAPGMLPAMCARTIALHNTTFGSIQTPHTLALLHGAAQAGSVLLEPGKERKRVFLRFGVGDLDAALAQMLVQETSVGATHAVERFTAGPVLEASLNTRLRQTLRTYEGLGMLDALTAHLIDQNLMEQPDAMFGMGPQASMALPEFMDSVEY